MASINNLTLRLHASHVCVPYLGSTFGISSQLQRSSWCIADYNITEKLYKGYASSVYKATCKNSGQVVVLKVYTLAAVCDLYKFQIYREVHLHSRLSHENIVKMHAAFQEGDKIVMVQEFADGADLFTVLKKYGGRLSERLAVQLVLEPFMRVLHYLHSMGILHRDVKPENILFTKNMELKLGDFGLAIDLREEKAVTRAGTLDYMAPEILRCPFKARPDENKDNAQLQYAGGVDSWAVGVLTYELLVGYPPFYDKTREGTENLILHSAPVFPMGVTEEARSFINCALTKPAMHRVVIGDMLKHPWIEGYRSGRSLRHTFGNPVRSCCLASPDHITTAALRNSQQQGVSPWRFLAANQSPEGCDAEGLKSVSSINPGVVSGPMHSMQQHQQYRSVLLKSTLAPATAVMLPRQHSLPVAAITSQMTTSPHFPSSLVNDDQAPIMQAMRKPQDTFDCSLMLVIVIPQVGDMGDFIFIVF
ncbi:hypothetical protein CEUSTIGMA_g11990.t1 [Chlamydomonas eustigma]|uniref:Protein kinase domain-containing protein n=1 Tax=Chlamydomonas eustigma TaxID=1157962 RepID=A0A250XNP8_9CHLO|nr:hypothetical protein CEUSTIGMA_g11990.t1 [Chlamydomonas eustigma]|eukprot:GAX84569.1 hypothetical protein CEUSTIGMA_g11990.t1 [Chlamydomonas eustigma]